MAIQQLYGREHRSPSFAQSLGTGLGEGLSMLLSHRVADITRQKRAKEWESIGLPSNVAHFLVNQPENVQKDFLDRLEGFQLSQSGLPSQGAPQSAQKAPAQESVAQQLPQELLQSAQPSQPSSANLVLGPSKEKRKENAEAFKATKEFRHDIIEKRKAARSDLQDLNRLEELSNSGKLDTPGYVEFLKRSGLDIPGLLNPESEEFQKIQANFLRNAKQYFGGRISNYEVEQFLKTIPSLSQSPEGRSRVIANLKKIARGAEEYYQASQEVLKEHRGVPPLDFEEKVEERIDKRLDAVAKKFKEDLKKPVPKGQNKFITALQTGLGSLVGSAGSVVKGAGKGAIAGSILGKVANPTGVGAIGGALGLL
jgi:hypothetical protein